MKQIKIALVASATIAVAGTAVFVLSKKNTDDVPAPQSSPSVGKSAPPPAVAAYKDVLRVREPKTGEKVASPLRVVGEARGVWFFEASFPVRLVDENGYVIARGHAQALGDWMTQDFVPFQGTLEFIASDTATGTLVFEKDNPFPVRFR